VKILQSLFNGTNVVTIISKNMVRRKKAIRDLILQHAVNLRYFGISLWDTSIRELLWRFRAGNSQRCRQHEEHIGWQNT